MQIHSPGFPLAHRSRYRTLTGGVLVVAARDNGGVAADQAHTRLVYSQHLLPAH